MSELAALGGQKTVDLPEPHFVWPEIDDALEQAVVRQINDSISIYNRSGIIEELEKLLEAHHGVSHCLLTNSGTSALHSLYVAAELEPGDEVICPSYTFFATVTPLFQTGAVPVLVDCEEDGNISPSAIEAAITSRTQAIMVTHMWGTPCRMDEISQIASKHGVALFEDTSHAFGATLSGQPVGSLGHAAAMSLQAQKPLPGGEGGVLITSDDEMYWRALLLGHYNKRCRDEIPDHFPLSSMSVTGMGLKLRIHPVAAAIARHRLGTFADVLAARTRVAARIVDALERLPGLDPVTPRTGVTSSWYAILIRYRPDQLNGLPLDSFHDAMIREGCAELDQPSSTRPLSHFPLFQRPWEVFPSYRGAVGADPSACPTANRLHQTALKLPVWHRASDAALVDRYIEAFEKVTTHHKDLL